MADTISISCSNCKKGYNVPGQLKGKKIRCKSCGQALTVEESKAAVDEEWGSVVNAYGVSSEKVDVIRCPHCADEIPDPTTIVCMNCGYNLRTRERMDKKVLEKTTGVDYFLWHLAAGINCLVIIGAIIFIVMVWTGKPDFGEYMDWLQEWKWARVYSTVACLFIIFFCGLFAFRRFVLFPHPPDKLKRLRKTADDD